MLAFLPFVVIALKPQCELASEDAPCCSVDGVCTPRTNFACNEGIVDCGENCTVALTAELQTSCPDGLNRRLIGLDCYACPEADTPGQVAPTSSPPPLEADIDVDSALNAGGDHGHDHDDAVNSEHGQENNDDSSGLGAGAIAGITVGAVAFVAIGAFVLGRA